MEGIGDERCAISILCPQARRTWPATSASPIRLQLDIPTETKRGERGIIVRGASGQRIMLEAKCGFARPQKDRGGELLHPEPVNLIADLTNPMWSSMVPDPRYRCLIPVAAFAQPDGKRGSMTRTWFRVNIRAVLSDIAAFFRPLTYLRVGSGWNWETDARRSRRWSGNSVMSPLARDLASSSSPSRPKVEQSRLRKAASRGRSAKACLKHAAASGRRPATK